MPDRDLKYFKVMAMIDKPGQKRHTLRVGSATMLADGVVVCTLDALPLEWDHILRLYPSDQEEKTNG